MMSQIQAQIQFDTKKQFDRRFERMQKSLQREENDATEALKKATFESVENMLSNPKCSAKQYFVAKREAEEKFYDHVRSRHETPNQRAMWKRIQDRHHAASAALYATGSAQVKTWVDAYGLSPLQEHLLNKEWTNTSDKPLDKRGNSLAWTAWQFVCHNHAKKLTNQLSSSPLFRSMNLEFVPQRNTYDECVHVLIPAGSTHIYLQCKLGGCLPSFERFHGVSSCEVFLMHKDSAESVFSADLGFPDTDPSKFIGLTNKSLLLGREASDLALYKYIELEILRVAERIKLFGLVCDVPREYDHKYVCNVETERAKEKAKNRLKRSLRKKENKSEQHRSSSYRKRQKTRHQLLNRRNRKRKAI